MIALGAGFSLFGLLAMGAGVAVLLKARAEAASRLSAPGVVVALRAVAGRRGYIHCPVIQFHGQSGELVSIESSVGAQPALHSVGQHVQVFYPRGRPGEAEIAPPTVLWLIPVGFLVLGFCFAAFGAGLLLLGLAA